MVDVTDQLLREGLETKGEASRAFGAYFEPGGMTNRALVIVGPDGAPWVTDSGLIRSDAFVFLTVAAQQTKTMKLGMGVALSHGIHEVDLLRWFAGAEPVRSRLKIVSSGSGGSDEKLVWMRGHVPTRFTTRS